jgi:hypothetical protein
MWLLTPRLLAKCLPVSEHLSTDTPFSDLLCPDNGFDASSHLPVTFTLRNTVGLTMGSSAAPIELVVDPDGQTIRGAPSAWPIDLRSVVCQHSMSLHTGVACLLQEVQLRGSVPHHSTHAATLPIVSGDKLIGFLVVYIGPGQPIDARLNDFLDLLMRQLSTSASMVAGYELEATSESMVGRGWRTWSQHGHRT